MNNKNSLYLDGVDRKIIDLLNLAPAHPSILARKVGLPRTTISYRLNRFQKHGIASMQKNGRKCLWQSTVPAVLDSGPVCIYRGNEIETAYSKLLTLPKRSEIISIQGGEAARGEILSLSVSFIRKAHRIFKTKGFVLKGISHESAIKHLAGVNKELIKSHVGRSVGLKLFTNELFKGGGEIFVSDSFVLISNPSQKMAITCTDKGVAGVMKDTCVLIYDLLGNMQSFDINDFFKNAIGLSSPSREGSILDAKNSVSDFVEK